MLRKKDLTKMADYESIIKKRKREKFYCAFLGKGVLCAIEENVDPDFVVDTFEQYTAAAARVLEYCSLLATYDKDDSPEETQNVVFMEKFQKEIDVISNKFLNYNRDIKKNAAKMEENKLREFILAEEKKKHSEKVFKDKKLLQIKAENFSFLAGLVVQGTQESFTNEMLKVMRTDHEEIKLLYESIINLEETDVERFKKIYNGEVILPFNQVLEKFMPSMPLLKIEILNSESADSCGTKSSGCLFENSVKEENFPHKSEEELFKEQEMPLKTENIESEQSIMSESNEIKEATNLQTKDNDILETKSDYILSGSFKTEEVKSKSKSNNSVESKFTDENICFEESENKSIVHNGVLCEILMKEETSPDQSKKKECVATNHKKIICEYCGKYFKKWISLRNHVETVHECSPESCNQCDKRMSQVMKLHVETNHDFISCENCEKCFKAFKSLQNQDKRTDEGLLHHCFRKWLTAKKRKNWLKETNRGKNRRAIWKKIKWLMKRSLYFAGRLYNFDYLVCQKCGHQHLIVHNVTPNYYCTDCDFKPRRQICDTFVTNLHSNTKDELSFASVREGSWSEDEDG